MTEEKKMDIHMGYMSKADQEEKMLEYIKDKKFQVEVEVLGKKKYAYVNDLADLDQFLKLTKGRIIQVKELKKNV